MKEKVLEMLRSEGDFLSGETISARLGVSRAAVWKVMQKLKEEGYAIESVPNRGYRLSEATARLCLSEIRANLPKYHPWRDLIQFQEDVDSTNTRLKLSASQGAPHGSVLIADHQTGGRGRRGRSFLSPAGKGLYLSRLMQPRCTVEELSMLTAWSAVALCDAVERACGVRPGIKWPNDLIMQGKKLCGVLTELELEAETGQPRYVIVGIGTNVFQTEADFGPEVAPVAISLAQVLDTPPGRTALAAEILRAMDDLYQDFPQARQRYLEQYRKDCLTLGKEISVVRPDGTRQGFASGINEDFALVARWEDGTEEPLSAGEVSVRGLYGYV